MTLSKRLFQFALLSIFLFAVGQGNPSTSPWVTDYPESHLICGKVKLARLSPGTLADPCLAGYTIYVPYDLAGKADGREITVSGSLEDLNALYDIPKLAIGDTVILDLRPTGDPTKFDF